jgi:hypothetical protein
VRFLYRFFFDSSALPTLIALTLLLAVVGILGSSLGSWSAPLEVTQYPTLAPTQRLPAFITVAVTEIALVNPPQLPTVAPSFTPSVTPTLEPYHSPTPVPTANFVSSETFAARQFPTVSINGISAEVFAPLPPLVQERVKLIYGLGQMWQRDARRFSKLGDSVLENPHFLTRFDGTDYQLADYAFLQPMLTYYQGSFGRQGVAVQRGLHTWAVFDPLWAGSGCYAGETILSCELRQHNPSVIFIRLGSNDVGVPAAFEQNLRRIIEFCMNNGIIPILVTKADRHEGGDINNPIVRRLASEYRVPLLDFDLLAGTLPARGVGGDGVHLTTYFVYDYGQARAFQTGNLVHNLAALIALDRIWQITTETRP